MTKPVPLEMPRSVSETEERVRRLELRVLAGGEEEPVEIAPVTPPETDPVVQWLVRGGQRPPTFPGGFTGQAETWAVTFGPRARAMWAAEQADWSEALNREARSLRQAVGLSASMEEIGEVNLTRATPDTGQGKEWRGLFGAGFESMGGFSGRFWNPGFRTKVLSMEVPYQVFAGDTLKYQAPPFVPSVCQSCFGLPCSPGLACGQAAATLFVPPGGAPCNTDFGPQWLWQTVPGNGFVWYDCHYREGFTPSPTGLCIPGCFGNAIYCHACSGGNCCVTGGCFCSSCEMISFGPVTAGRPVTNDFGFDFRTGVNGACCAGGSARVLTGNERMWGPWGNQAHVGSACGFCSGVVSNQSTIPNAYVFTIRHDRLRARGPVRDLAPTNRNWIASYSTDRTATQAIVGSPTWDADTFHGGVPYDGYPKPARDWWTVRADIYAKLATGCYPAVEAFIAAMNASYVPPIDGWQDVPLVGSWTGRLAFRRVGGFVQWRGTVTSKHAPVNENGTVAFWIPEEAMPLRPALTSNRYLWGSTPAGALLLSITAGVSTGVAAATGAIEIPRAGTHLVGNNVYSNIETNPLGTEESITFDGISYPAADVRSGPVIDPPWITSLPV